MSLAFLTAAATAAAAEEAAHRAATMLEYGAIMLGTALLFVTVFRRLGLGATLGYIVGGIVIGPQVLALVTEPERLSARC